MLLLEEHLLESPSERSTQQLQTHGGHLARREERIRDALVLAALVLDAEGLEVLERVARVSECRLESARAGFQRRVQDGLDVCETLLGVGSERDRAVVR